MFFGGHQSIVSSKEGLFFFDHVTCSSVEVTEGCSNPLSEIEASSLLLLRLTLTHLSDNTCCLCDQLVSTNATGHCTLQWSFSYSLYRSDGTALSADLSQNSSLHSCDTCSNSNRDVATVWKRGVS